MLKIIMLMLTVTLTVTAYNINQIQLTNNKKSLKIIKFNNQILFTGLKNRGLYTLQSQEILPKSITIINLYKNNDSIIIETDKGFYKYNQKTLLKTQDNKVKQENQKIYLKINGVWKKISPNNNDIYYAPKTTKDFVLFSGVKSGILLYDIKKQKTTFISKGVDALFSSDGQKVTFAKVYDDGEKYTDSEIFIYDIKSSKIIKVLDKKQNEINRYPYLDQNTLYFNKNFDIFKINLSKEL